MTPHAHAHVLGRAATATRDDAKPPSRRRCGGTGLARTAVRRAAAALLRAADLLAGPWRDRLNAATMLGQSKTAYQAEIDAACELADFWRFNVAFARQVLAEQPIVIAPGIWNRIDHRPLEGFVYAVTPFNFTAIAGNLPTAPALMGNVVVWKPSITQQLAASLTMDLLEEAGLPPGVINMLTGDGPAISEVVLADPDWPASTSPARPATFQHLWRTVGEQHRQPTGPTRGWSARPAARTSSSRTPPRTSTCCARRWSAARSSTRGRSARRRRGPTSRARSGTAAARRPVAETDGLTIGDVDDFTNFAGAVIDERAFDRLAAAIDRAHADPSLDVIAGGTDDDTDGYFVGRPWWWAPTPIDDIFCTEYFGPILSVHVYADDDFDTVLRQVDEASPYALTGSIIAHDRAAVETAIGGAAVRGRQLLHQRQADRRGGRAAALRRRPGVRHERQGRVGRTT